MNTLNNCERLERIYKISFKLCCIKQLYCFFDYLVIHELCKVISTVVYRSCSFVFMY